MGSWEARERLLESIFSTFCRGSVHKIWTSAGPWANWPLNRHWERLGASWWRDSVEVAECKWLFGTLQARKTSGPVYFSFFNIVNASDQLPACLHDKMSDLLDSSSKGLGDEQRKKLQMLITKYQAIFDQGIGRKGLTNKVRHKIYMGDVWPIRQIARKLPLSKREEAENIIKEMEGDGLIGTSICPWSSLVVLVKKKGWMTRRDIVWTIGKSTVTPYQELTTVKVVPYSRPEEWLLGKLGWKQKTRRRRSPSALVCGTSRWCRLGCATCLLQLNDSWKRC